MKCIICESELKKEYYIKDFRYQLSDKIFSLQRCSVCNIYHTLYNESTYDPMVYYSTEYGAFHNTNNNSKVKNFGTFHYKLNNIFTPWISFGRMDWMNKLEINDNSIVLDVGCGTGKLYFQWSDVSNLLDYRWAE